MPYFLIEQNLELGKDVEIGGEEARHILLSHRMKVGQRIKIQDLQPKRYLSEITKVNKKTLNCRPVEEIALPKELAAKITLFQAVVAEKALDFIFQKGTELGVSSIILFNSQNTAAKLSQEQFKKKQERWNKILIEAAKQSERSLWPSLSFAEGLAAAIPLMTQDKIFLTDIGGSKPLSLVPNPSSLALIVGPEGGLSSEELAKLKQSPKLQLIHLSPFVLRAETAALAGIVILNAQ